MSQIDNRRAASNRKMRVVSDEAGIIFQVQVRCLLLFVISKPSLSHCRNPRVWMRHDTVRWGLKAPRRIMVCRKSLSHCDTLICKAFLHSVAHCRSRLSQHNQ